MNKALLIGLLGCSSMYFLAFAQQPNVTNKFMNGFDNPVELGAIDWIRDLDKAKEVSNETGKPLFVQFQEVPG